MTVSLKKREKGGRDVGAKWCEGEGGNGMERGAVGSQAGGDNRKRARSAQRRVGLKAQPMAAEGKLSVVCALPL
jgi:hypothetical protein